ncbi:MAG: hypothetical protein ACRC76_02630 [Proteocatella sp.]
MKKLLSLTLITTLALSTVSFAEPDTAIGQIEKAKLSIFRIDEKKLYERALAENKAEAEKTRKPVKEPVIIKAETLPTNNIPQFTADQNKEAIVGYREGVVGKNAAIRKNRDEVFGKSVTITKKQLLEADYVLMQSLALKNFRKVGTSSSGGDIYAIDVMTLQTQGGGEWNTSAQKVLGVKIKGREYTYPANRTKSIPKFESEEKVFYDVSDEKGVEIGKWYTTTIGNTLKENKDSTFPYSSKNIEYIKINTMPYEDVTENFSSYFIPAPESATQLIITEW